MELRFAIAAFVLVVSAGAGAAAPILDFTARDADQGVAVDADFVYVIDNTTVAKHAKDSGELLERWESTPDRPLIHMNSGSIHDGRLYCAHSNYPGVPMTSSIEVFETDPLRHVESHSLGIGFGSLTWFERHDGRWWACFAHYDGKGGEAGKDHRWTILVEYDDALRPGQSWTFPPAVLERMKPHSCSGGAWGPDGLLYTAGHDRPELYALRLPQSGSALQLVRTISFPTEGQAFCFDRSGTGLIYGLIRSENRVIARPFDALDVIR